MHSATRTDKWTEARNLCFERAARRRETLIYLMGRIGKEELPTEAWVFIAQNAGDVGIRFRSHSRN